MYVLSSVLDELMEKIDFPKCERVSAEGSILTLTCIEIEFLPQVVVGLFGHLVGRAVLGLILFQEAAQLLDLL